MNIKGLRRSAVVLFVLAALAALAVPAAASIIRVTTGETAVHYQTWEFYNGDTLHFAVSVKSSDYAPETASERAAAYLQEVGAPAGPDAGEAQEFTGWYLQNADGSYGDGWAGYPDAVAFDDSVTKVYAKFRDLKHYVSYHSAVDSDADGSFDTYPTIHVVEVNAGEELAVHAGTPLFVTPAGTANVGWSPRKGAISTDADVYGYGEESQLTVNEDIDLYPVIEGGYWVSFDSAGGTGVDRQFVSEGKTVTRPADPTRKGYSFTGWVDGEGAPFDFATPVTGAVTLTATWEEAQTTYRLRFYLQGAEPKATVEEDYAYDPNYYYEVPATTGDVISLSPNDPNISAAISAKYSENGGAIPDYFANSNLLNAENAKNVTVASDGSTVFTVYLDRIWYYLKTGSKGGNASYAWRWGQKLYDYYQNKYKTARADDCRIMLQYAGKTAQYVNYRDARNGLVLSSPYGLYQCCRQYSANPPATGIPCGYTLTTAEGKVDSTNWTYDAYHHYEKLDSTGTGVDSDFEEVHTPYASVHDHANVVLGYTGFSYLRSTNTKLYSDSSIKNRIVPARFNGKTSAPYHVWYTRNKHDVIWNENGGPEAQDLKSIYYGTNLTDTQATLADGTTYVAYDKDPDADGFAQPTTMTDAAGDHWFTGWHQVNTLVDDVYSFDGVTMPDRDIVLYASWVPARCKVTYDLAGGTLSQGVTLVNRSAAAGQKSATDVLDYGQQATGVTSDQVTPPSGSGELLGWTYQSAGQDVTWSFANEVHSDVTLRAVYAPEGATTTAYSLTYDAGEGATGTAPVDLNTYLKGATAFMPSGTSLYKDGKPFLYWRDSAGDAHYAGSRYTVTGNMTLTAVYSATADLDFGKTTLAFDYNYGSMSPNTSLAGLTPEGSTTRQVYVNQAMDLDAFGFPDVSGAVPVGYTFGGWYTDAARTTRLDDVIVDATDAASDNVVYAGWERNSYDVSFDKNDEAATGTMTPQGFEYDIEQALAGNAFAKTGYHFGGWATSASATASYADKEGVSNLTATDDATVPLYATWVANPYQVHFNKGADAATGSMDNQDMTYDADPVALTANAFSNTGYHFAGWATAAGGARAYDDKAQVSNLTTEQDGTVDLYALWDANQLTVDAISGTFTYSGSEHKPEPTVRGLGGAILARGVDYQLSWANNVNAGTATVTVSGIAGGDYQAAEPVEVTFQIDKATWDAPAEADATTTQSHIATTVTAEGQTTTDDHSGTLTLAPYDATKPAEYSVDEGATWTDLTATGSAAGLAAGNVQLRYKADDNHNASAPLIVAVRYGVSGSVTWDWNYSYVDGGEIRTAVVNDTPQERSSAANLYVYEDGTLLAGYPVALAGVTDPVHDATLTHAYGTYAVSDLLADKSYSFVLSPTVANTAGDAQIESASYSATRHGDGFAVAYVGVGNFDGAWTAALASAQTDGHTDVQGVYVKVYWASRDDAALADASLYAVVSQQNDATMGTYCLVGGEGASRTATGSLPVWKMNTDGYPSRYRAKVTGFRVDGVDYPCSQEFWSSLDEPLAYDPDTSTDDEVHTIGQDPMAIAIQNLHVPMVALDANGGTKPAAGDYLLGQAAAGGAYSVARTAIEAREPSWDGRAFEGWFASASPLATDRLSADVTGLTQKATLYAHWSEDQAAPEALGAQPVSAQFGANGNVARDGSGNAVVNADGVIQGVDDTMEWRAQGEGGTWPDAWTRVPAGATSVSGLAAGTYQVRYAATEATADAWPKNASEPAQVTVTAKAVADAPAAPAVTEEPTTITVDAVSGQLYSIDDGATWVAPAPGATTVAFEGLTPGTEHSVVTRVAETDGAYASDISAATTVVLPLLNLDVPEVTGLTLTYDGSPQALLGEVEKPEGCEAVSYSFDEDTWSSDVLTGIDAGTYRVLVMFVGDATHNDATATATATIGRAPNEWATVPSIEGWVAGQQASAPAGSARFGETSFAYRAQADADGEWMTAVPTEPGRYLLRASVEACDNWSAVEALVPFEVAADTLTYDPNSVIARGATPAYEGKTGDVATVAASGFVWEHHAFLGWNTAADGTGESYAPGSEYPLTAGTDVLYAQWDPRGELAYDGNGATSGAMTSRPGHAGEAVEVAACGFARQGYEFAGWNTAADGSGTVYAPGASLELALGGDVLYAQWRRLPDRARPMYRLYNPNSGEHFYTSSATERDVTVAAGWRYEGLGWKAPATSDSPVFRLYNAYAGDHHYTLDAGERDALVAVGWTDEGVGWYSDDARGVALWRQYNPNALAGAHNFTADEREHVTLCGLGWRGEGIAWYGVR